MDISRPPLSTSSRERPNIETAVITMEVTSGIRGPNLVISAPASGEATIIIAVSGSSRSPLSTGLSPCTFCR